VANDGIPLQLEGRGIHRGAGKLVLTLVATGHSAGVGEAERCVLVGVDEEDSGVQRKLRKMCAATRSGSSLPDGSGSAKTASSHG
jgi:hypothetical protein